VRADDLLTGALVSVKLTMLGRGCPEILTMIYQLDNAEVEDWRRTEANAGKLLMDPDTGEEGTELPQAAVSSDIIIGYVTSGNYSLSIGKGYAIGAVPVSKFLEIQKQAKRFGAANPLVKVRNREGVVCRMAQLQLLDR